MSELSHLRRENNELEKKLTKGNSDLITRMYFYLLSSRLKETEVEIIRKDLTGMALEAQERGESFEDMIGGEYKQFCEDLIANGRRKTPAVKILEVAETLLYAGIVLLIVEMTLAGSVDFGSILVLTPSFFALVLFVTVCATIILWILSRAVWGLPAGGAWKSRLAALMVAGLILVALPLFAIVLPDTELIRIYPWPVFAAMVAGLIGVICIRRRLE